MDNKDATVGSNLRKLREARGLSQAELAQALTDVGLPGFHPQTITKIEKGIRAIKLVEGIPLAGILGVEPASLLEATNSALTAAALHRALDDSINQAAIAHGEISSAIRELLGARAKLKGLLSEQGQDISSGRRHSAERALERLTVDSAISEALAGRAVGEAFEGLAAQGWSVDAGSLDEIKVGDVLRRLDGVYLEPGP